MIKQPIEFHLLRPWNGELFQRERWGFINFLVGPNGSGKSRFANQLKEVLPGARLLGTDRLQGTGINVLKDLWGDNTAGGYQKGNFSYIKQAGLNYGSGLRRGCRGYKEDQAPATRLGNFERLLAKSLSDALPSG
ncbi:hypothetical protein AM571_CH02401 [Rhizobium etli 8C-3]|uniref:AAA domain-containing protein n=1 Tax=Rhizobium etli 8C-3 TaxID=538025 RepID=A0A1L5P514_RHIET|nr:hypothetical protein [Rhizobium etli]APO75210.1 hypothetical protein AM571_CH02401 [Rhizobium etli 8C-3]